MRLTVFQLFRLARNERDISSSLAYLWGNPGFCECFAVDFFDRKIFHFFIGHLKYITFRELFRIVLDSLIHSLCLDSIEFCDGKIQQNVLIA